MSAEAIARAAGILGGEGIDTIRNEGTLTVEADAIAGAGSIAVGISSGDEGGPAKAKTDASGKATTHSTGISGGSGDDTIVNIAPVNVTATSTVGEAPPPWASAWGLMETHRPNRWPGQQGSAAEKGTIQSGTKGP